MLHTNSKIHILCILILLLIGCGKNPLIAVLNNTTSEPGKGGKVIVSFNYFNQAVTGLVCTIVKPNGESATVTLDNTGKANYICNVDGDYTVIVPQYLNCPGYSKTTTVKGGLITTVSFTEYRTTTVQNINTLNYGAVAGAVKFLVSYSDSSTVPVPLNVSISNLPAEWSTSPAVINTGSSATISANYPDFFSNAAPTFAITGTANGTVLNNNYLTTKNYTDPNITIGKAWIPEEVPAVNLKVSSTNYFGISLAKEDNIPLDKWTITINNMNVPTGLVIHDITPYVTVKNNGHIGIGQWSSGIDGITGKDSWGFRCDYSITDFSSGSPDYLFIFGNIPWQGLFSNNFFNNGTSSVTITFNGSKSWTLTPAIRYPIYS